VGIGENEEPAGTLQQLEELPLLRGGVLELVADHQRPPAVDELSDGRRCEEPPGAGDQVVVGEPAAVVAEETATGHGLDLKARRAAPGVAAEAAQEAIGERVERLDLDAVAHSRKERARAAGDLPYSGAREGHEQHTLRGGSGVAFQMMASGPQGGGRLPRAGAAGDKYQRLRGRDGLTLARGELLELHNWCRPVPRSAMQRVASSRMRLASRGTAVSGRA
jgi:hypothetical protein